jgi:hypothetical protein
VTGYPVRRYTLCISPAGYSPWLLGIYITSNLHADSIFLNPPAPPAEEEVQSAVVRWAVMATRSGMPCNIDIIADFGDMHGINKIMADRNCIHVPCRMPAGQLVLEGVQVRRGLEAGTLCRLGIHHADHDGKHVALGGVCPHSFDPQCLHHQGDPASTGSRMAGIGLYNTCS